MRIIRYKGWLPTVSGKLSFDIIGSGIHPNPPIIANVADKNSRFILCSQKRNLLDNILPFKTKFARTLFHQKGDFVFLCLAESSNNIKVLDGSLRGTLLIFKADRWDQKLSHLFGLLIHELQCFGNIEHSKPTSLKDSYEIKFEIEKLYFRNNSDFNVKFQLDRNGTVTIEVPEDMKTAPDAPAIDSASYEHTLHNLCSQLFFGSSSFQVG